MPEGAGDALFVPRRSGKRQSQHGLEDRGPGGPETFSSKNDLSRELPARQKGDRPTDAALEIAQDSDDSSRAKLAEKKSNVVEQKESVSDSPTAPLPGGFGGRENAKGKLTHDFNGNSLIIENGDAVYAELQHRQGGYSRSGSTNRAAQEVAPAAKPAPPAGLITKQGSSLEAISRNGVTPRIDGIQQRGALQNGYTNSNGLQYGNSAYGVRNRRRAIVVLRVQTPPPATAPNNP